MTVFRNAIKANDINEVKRLLKKGFGVNEKGHAGTTALHCAVYYWRKEIVMLFIQLGAHRNVRNFYGRTPLDVARSRGNRSVVKYLEETRTDLKLNSKKLLYC